MGGRADACTVENTEVLQFAVSAESDGFSVYAEEPLRIHNQALGYELVYDLIEFKYIVEEGEVHEVLFKGPRRFTDLETNSKTTGTAMAECKETCLQGVISSFSGCALSEQYG